MIRTDEVPLIKPWGRDETVMCVVQGILSDKAWDRLPVLADALEDAGCDDFDLLNSFRGQLVPDWMCVAADKVGISQFYRVVRGVVTVKQVEEAKEFFDRWAKEFREEDVRGTPTEWFLEVLADHEAGGDGFTTYGYDNPDIPLDYMWRHYETLTGSPAPEKQDRYENSEGVVSYYPYQPFGCSC